MTIVLGIMGIVFLLESAMIHRNKQFISPFCSPPSTVILPGQLGFAKHIQDMIAMFVYAPDTRIKVHLTRFGSGTGEWTCVTRLNRV